MIMLGDDASGQTVDLPVGQAIELRLAENPTSGFRWRVAGDGKPACDVVIDAFESGGTRPGAGGEHVWRFEGKSVGECDIELRYGRAWQRTAPSASERVFTVHVRVRR
jgi:inhibitor of cysteine peptidase